EDTRVVAEPAGALAVAGMKKWVASKPGGDAERSLVAIVSGANIDFHRLRHISERAELGEQREGIFAVTIPERPGGFRQPRAAIGARGITEFNSRYADPREARVCAGAGRGRGREERGETAGARRARGHGGGDMTGNEPGVPHPRHMVGGRVPAALEGE